MKINFYKLFSLFFFLGALFFFGSKNVHAATISSYTPISSVIPLGTNLAVNYTVVRTGTGSPGGPRGSVTCSISGTGVATQTNPPHSSILSGSFNVGPVNSDTTLTLSCIDTLASPPPVYIDVFTVSAGADKSINNSPGSVQIIAPTNSFSRTLAWTKVSGPAGGTIASPSSSTTIITGMTTPGTYVFRLTATDNLGATGFDDVQVVVNAPPTVSAGVDRAITLPTSSLSITGTASDTAPGTISSTAWTKVSGPAGGTIASPASLTTNITGMATSGTYVFRLTATDNLGSTSFDDMQIVVSPVALPELSAGSATPSTAIAGTSPTFSASISNTGTSSSGATFVNLFQIATAANGGGTITSVIAVPNPMPILNTGASAPITSISPIALSAGTYSVRFCADKNSPASTGTITESNEANNCAPWVDITVTVAAQSDLTASTPTQSSATVGVPLAFSSTVSNVGTASTGSSFSNFFQVATSTNGGGTVTGLVPSTMSTLVNGASGTATSPLYTFSSGQCSGGVCSVSACADKTSTSNLGTITESNESNNCSAWRNVTVGVAALPDLTAGAVVPTIASVGTPVIFSATVTNIGNATTAINYSNFSKLATTTKKIFITYLNDKLK